MENSQILDILKSAILLERRGKAFYKKVAEISSDQEVKKIFTLMAKEEDLHIRTLSEQYINFTKSKEFKNINFKKSSDEGAVSDFILSKDIKRNIEGAGFEAAAISAAIDMENKAIDLYTDRAHKADAPAEKSLYNWLAEWEQGHLSILNELNKELTFKIWNDNSFWPF